MNATAQATIGASVEGRRPPRFSPASGSLADTAAKSTKGSSGDPESADDGHATLVTHERLAGVRDAWPTSGNPLELFADMRTLPHSYIVHAATDDRNAPLIARGDVVVVDIGGPSVTGGWLPTEGGLFLIEYCSPPAHGERYARRSWSIVQTFTDDEGRWWAGSTRRGVQGREFFAACGPYADECALADKLIGQVVGLYWPAGAMQ